MNAGHRRQIEQAFSAAAEYDRHARVQRVAARRLAARIADLPLPAFPRVLEIGCGTGFLTEALMEHGIGGDWLITDISPDMLDRCQARLGKSTDRRFMVLDGEYGDPGGPFDLVCSSLAMQWFDNQAAAFARTRDWLAPGGHSIATTLGAGSFAEWRAAHAAEQVEAGMLDFLPAERLPAVAVERHVERHDSALDFLRALKAIGAHTAPSRHRPLPPPALRRVMRRFEAAGAAVSYEIITCHYQRA